MKNILVVPAIEQKRGGGHLCRCISLTCDLRAMGCKAMLYLPSQTVTSNFVNFFESMNFNRSWLIFDEEIKIKNENFLEKFDFIVLDRFNTPLDELLHWQTIAPVIGIDEGSKHRDKFDFLIDILVPLNFYKHRANIASPRLINLPKDFMQKHKDTEKIKILVTFGQEDSAGLGIKTAVKLSKIKTPKPLEITLLKGNLNTASNNKIPESVKVLDSIPNLSAHLHEYDLVITHYGLTAYEAFFAGVPVLLDHPTRLHKKLAKSAGFKTFSKFLTRRHGDTENTKLKTLCDLGVLSASVRNKSDNFSSLSELINSFALMVNRCCPVCGSEKNLCSARFSDRTYRNCKKCGIIYMDRTCPPPIEYEKEYFFENYVKQYGKTYLEDFENIKTAGKNRLKIIAKISHGGTKTQRAQRRNKPADSSTLFSLRARCDSVSLCDESGKPSLLDIGCAYGPFLKAAQEEGFSPFGLDPAQDAVKYVNEKLGIPAINSFFPVSDSKLPAPFDVITLWFTIEHFTDCNAVLTEIKKILKPDGILAFSTPSFSGISGKKSLGKFLSASPADHFTVWSPKSAKKALSLAGFKVKKIKVAGHHPQRFPLLGKLAKTKKSPLYWALLAISKLFGLGDTFEVYAQIN
ncbi:MAG: methyltransferase domain-containing protein [Treponema sp.]|nr:methyltransferase domain-containing protein [Treponema sp.]